MVASGAEDVDEPLHARLLAGCGVPGDDTLACCRVNLLDHVFQCRFGKGFVLGMSGFYYVTSCSTHAALCLFVAQAPFFILLVPLFGRRESGSQAILRNYRIPQCQL